MSVRTEFEIRFIFDASKPISVEEREFLLGTIQQWGYFRTLHSHRGNVAEDVKQLTAAAMQMPVNGDAPPAVDIDLPARIGPPDVRARRERQRENEREIILKALRASTTVESAARRADMDRRTFYRRVQAYGISARQELLKA